MDELNEELQFPGKIAVITNPVEMKQDDYYSVDRLYAKYGTDKIIHITWPADFISEQKQVEKTILNPAANPEVKALVINQVVSGTNAAVKKLKEIRSDIFIVYTTSVHDTISEAIENADLLLIHNMVGCGSAMVKQAKKQGAKVFVYYSFPRHMAAPILANSRDLVRETCLNEGLKFLELTALDPADEPGIPAAQQFIQEDVPKVVAEYGEDTAFYSTNCYLQAPLIKAVIDNHAIFIQTCCPSPFHGFPEALGLKTGKGISDLNKLINDICSIAIEKNMTDRLSTWPVSASMMYTNAGAEYAVKWLRGEVPKDHIDNKVLKECLDSYIEDVIGEESYVHMASYTEGDKTYNNFKMVLMSYLDF